MMKLSVWSSYFIDCTPEEALALFKKNGICATELSDEHGKALLDRSEDVKSTGRAFGAYAKELGVAIPQGHLWLNCHIVSDPNAVDLIKKWIDLYEAIGIKNMVLHADVYQMEDKTIEQIREVNAEKLCEIAAHLEGKDVYVCLENLSRHGMNHVDHLLSLINLVGSDHLGITLDTGHLNLAKTTSQRDFILAAGNRLRAIHIADNEGASDQHLMPFGRGNVDFFEVVKALREIGYKGIFNYEIPGENHCPLPVREMKLKYIIESYQYLMS